MINPNDEATKTANHICNLCGLPCAPPGSNPQTWGEQGLLARVCGGFSSTPGNGEGALDDCAAYSFSLCEFCLDWLFGKFQVPVAVCNYMSGKDDLEPWRPAAQRVMEDEWRREKSEFMEEYERRKEAREKAIIKGNN